MYPVECLVEGHFGVDWTRTKISPARSQYYGPQRFLKKARRSRSGHTLLRLYTSPGARDWVNVIPFAAGGDPGIRRPANVWFARTNLRQLPALHCGMSREARGGREGG